MYFRWCLCLSLLSFAHAGLFGNARRGAAKPDRTIVASTPDESKLNFVDLLLAGAFATMAGDFALHPIDTIKTVQQAAEKSMSMVGAGRLILTKYGPTGFYKGVGPYLLSDGISGSIKLVTYELSKRWVQTRVKEEYLGYTHFLCAAGAFVVCSFALVPGELLKSRLQAGMCSSLGECVSHTWKTEGFKGFFMGYGATLLRDVPYTMLELGLYDNFKTMIRQFKGTKTLTNYDELTAAAVTGAITGWATNPLDIVKTKLMTQSTSNPVTGVRDACRIIYRAGGVNGFNVGSLARVCWLLPFTTIYLGVYEISKRSFLKLKPSTD